jgi:hypothetical protein
MRKVYEVSRVIGMGDGYVRLFMRPANDELGEVECWVRQGRAAAYPIGRKVEVTIRPVRQRKPRGR